MSGWGVGLRRGFGLRRWPRGGGYGRGVGWRWDDVTMPTDVPPAGFADVEGLAEQVRVLASRVEELSARLEAKGGNGG